MTVTKYNINPKSKLRMTKQMLIKAGIDPNAVLSNWLMLYKCNGSLIHEISIEYHLELLRDMLKESGHDLEECLEDWRYNYRKKLRKPRKEKFSTDQQKAMDKINSFNQKAFGIGLKVYR